MIYHNVGSDDYLSLLGGCPATTDDKSLEYFKVNLNTKVWTNYAVENGKILVAQGARPIIEFNGPENEIQAHIFSGLSGSVKTGMKGCPASLHSLKITNNQTVVQAPCENKGNVLVKGRHYHAMSSTSGYLYV